MLNYFANKLRLLEPLFHSSFRRAQQVKRCFVFVIVDVVAVVVVAIGVVVVLE